MWLYILLGAGIFMGWSLGTNDAANAFGTAVATGVVKYRTAVSIIAVMVVLGAFLQGSLNLESVNKLAITNAVIPSEDGVRAQIAAGNTGLTIGVELAWEGGSLDVTFAEGEDEAAFAAAWAAAYKQNKNIWLYVDIAGLTGLESDLTVKPVLNSADSTLYTGSIVYTVG